MAENENEHGQCSVCGKDGIVERTYFHYDMKCECHSPNHFEIIRHCSTCTPKEPTETRVSIKTDKLKKSMSTQAVNPDAQRVISDFEKELTSLINRYSRENRSDTPDFILAQYIDSCMTAFDAAVLRRDQWYGRDPFADSTTFELKKKE